LHGRNSNTCKGDRWENPHPTCDSEWCVPYKYQFITLHNFINSLNRFMLLSSPSLPLSLSLYRSLSLSLSLSLLLSLSHALASLSSLSLYRLYLSILSDYTRRIGIISRVIRKLV
jgi:hypothetical protein